LIATIQDVARGYGPGVRYTQARDLKVGTLIVMTRGKSGIPDCTPIVSIATEGGMVRFTCENLFSYQHHPRGLVLTYEPVSSIVAPA